MYKFSEASRENRRGIDQRLLEIGDLALSLSPIDFGIPPLGGIRTIEEQENLYKAGKSKTLNSKHLTGKAVDVFAFIGGEASWDIYCLTMIAAAHLQAASILGYRLRWGGLWKTFKDYPHFELEE